MKSAVSLLLLAITLSLPIRAAAAPPADPWIWLEDVTGKKSLDWVGKLNAESTRELAESAKYPRTLFTSSTRDDRVHPGHARKMVAKMKEQGHDVLYYENVEGGHAGAADNKQQAFMSALAYTFLWKQLQ